MRIVKANFHDVPVIATLEQESIKSYSSLEMSIHNFRDHQLTNTYVAKIDNQIIGYVTLAWLLNGRDQGAWIDMLAIKQGFRRQGIGKALVNKAMHLAKQRGYNILFVGSYKYYRATNFYLKLGFKIIREDTDGFNRYRDFSIKIA